MLNRADCVRRRNSYNLTIIIIGYYREISAAEAKDLRGYRAVYGDKAWERVASRCVIVAAGPPILQTICLSVSCRQ